MLTTTVCAALSAAGLAVAFLTVLRRRFAAATRIAAVALLPVGLAMAGLVTLAGEISAAVGGWAAGLVFRPTVWAGFAVLATALVLYVAGRAAGRRGRTRREAVGKAGQPGRAAERGAPAPSLGAGTPPAARPAKPSGGADDFSDIEAILKKHGI